MHTIWLIAFLVFCCVSLPADSDGSYDFQVKKLKKKLFEKYKREEAPPIRPVILHTFLAISHIEEVNETEETIRLHGQFYMFWNDQRLVWNPEDYGGIWRFSAKTYSILPWTPKIYFSNRARQVDWSSELTWRKARMSYNSVGRVDALIPFGTPFTCNFEYSNFPYDQQRCPLIISSFVEMNMLRFCPSNGSRFGFYLTPSHLFSFSYHETAERRTGTWIVTGGNLSFPYYLFGKGLMDSDEGLNPEKSYHNMRIWINIQRHVPYFGVSMVLPVVLVNLLTTVCAVVPWKGLSVRLLFFILLLLFLFSANLMHSLPPATGPVPNIVIYYGLSLTQTMAILGVRLFLIWVEVTVPLFKSATQMEDVTVVGIFQSKDNSALIRYSSFLICAVIFIVAPFLLL